MSDWDLVESSSSQKARAASGQNFDWELVPNAVPSQKAQNEGFGTALLKAPYRVGEDLYKGTANFIRSIPSYWNQAETEVPGALHSLVQHPAHALGQLGAGATEMGHNLLNSPRGFADYFSNRLNLLPQEYAKKVPYQEDISGDINQVFGEPKYSGEKLIRGIGRNALNVAGGVGAANILNPMKLTAKGITKDVMKAREKNIDTYGSLYQDLWRDAEKSGFSDALHHVDIDMPILKKYSGDKSIKGVVDFNNNPTIENAHAAKSDLLKIQRELNKKTTLNTAERQQKNAANNAINSLKENMFRGNNGAINKKMLERYEKIQNGYRNEVIPYKNKAINEFLRDEINEEELVNSLSKRAFARKRGKFHPRMGIRNKIKNHPYLTGIGLGSVIPAIYKGAFGNSTE